MYNGRKGRHIVKFAWCYLIYSLSNGTNLQKQKQKQNIKLSTYQYNEAQLYLFNHCLAALKWRRDSITQTIMNNLVAIDSETWRLYADINGNECPRTLFKSKRRNEANAEMYRSRTDIIIRKRKCITVTELTYPFERNLPKSYDYKVTKYQSLRRALHSTCSHLKLILLEISSLGFTRSSIKTFETYLNGKKLDSVRIIKKYQEVAIRASYYIYCRRNKICLDLELILYT